MGCRRLSLDDKYALQMYSGAQKLEQTRLLETSKSDRNIFFKKKLKYFFKAFPKNIVLVIVLSVFIVTFI